MLIHSCNAYSVPKDGVAAGTKGGRGKDARGWDRPAECWEDAGGVKLRENCPGQRTRRIPGGSGRSDREMHGERKSRNERTATLPGEKTFGQRKCGEGEPADAGGNGREASPKKAGTEYPGKWRTRRRWRLRKREHAKMRIETGISTEKEGKPKRKATEGPADAESDTRSYVQSRREHIMRAAKNACFTQGFSPIHGRKIVSS